MGGKHAEIWDGEQNNPHVGAGGEPSGNRTLFLRVKIFYFLVYKGEVNGLVLHAA